MTSSDLCRSRSMANVLPGHHRARLCRAEYQPNLLEYIDNTLTESVAVDLTLPRTLSTRDDPFSNTMLDQYLLYLLCQKIDPALKDFSRLLHQLILRPTTISKGFFEYSPPSNRHRPIYQANFASYTNFIWNELDVTGLLGLGCCLLKYRLRDVFKSGDQTRILGFFLEILVIYYLSSNQRDSFLNSRSFEMILPSPSVYFLSSFVSSTADSVRLESERQAFEKFLVALDDNGEVDFDLSQVRHFLHDDAHRFVQKKLQNHSLGFLSFLQTHLLSPRCRSLKSICRQRIKMQIQHFPTDIQRLRLLNRMTAQLQTFLVYDNQCV